MGPFLKKLKKWQRKSGKAQKNSSLAFLETHTSPVNESMAEKVTPHGGASALALGERMHTYYKDILPRNASLTLDMWAADATRDTLSARAFLKGLMPKHSGDDGSGDSHVKLISVPTTDPEWNANLTPHKVGFVRRIGPSAN
jgi:hypothetical protein